MEITLTIKLIVADWLVREPLGLGEENTNPDLKILERDFAFVFYENPKLDYE